MTSRQRDAEARPTGRRLFTWKRAAATIVALLSCIVVWLWFEVRMTSGMVAEIRARGEPTNWEELEASRPTVPPERDTGRLWLDAARKLNDPELESGERFATIPHLGADADELDVETTWSRLDPAVEFLDKHAASIDELHAVARAGRAARFPIEYRATLDGGPDIDFTEELWRAAKCLSLEAGVRARQGNIVAAIDAACALAALESTLRDEPLMFLQLTAISFGTSSEAQTRLLLERSDLDDPQLMQLADALEPFDWRRSFQQAMTGERVGGIELFDEAAEVGLKLGPVSLVRIVRARDERIYLAFMDKLINACDEAPQQAMALIDQAGQELSETPEWLCPITMRIVPSSAVLNVSMRAAASRQIVLLAIALERFRRAHGRPPASLDELVPEFLDAVPRDAVTGQPIGYQTEGADGYVVFSPWKGAAFGTADPATGADERLLFRWPPPPPRVDGEEESEEAVEGEEAAQE